MSTEGLTLIAHGGQAEIFDCGDGKILRVAKRPQDFDRILFEYTVYASLSGRGLSVPHAYELVRVDGAPAIIMEKIPGDSMMSIIARNPFKAGRMARQLARLHLELSKVRASPTITSTKAKAEFCIKASQVLSERTKERVFEVLKELPDGSALCHGDFHPGNIICHDGSNYLIDWVGASRGDFRADVAHTYILLRVVPRVPHLNGFIYFMQKRIGRAMANRYLAGVGLGSTIDSAMFSKWVLVNAAERTYHGMQSEKARLSAFIDRYLGVLDKGGNQRLLYKAL